MVKVRKIIVSISVYLLVFFSGAALVYFLFTPKQQTWKVERYDNGVVIESRMSGEELVEKKEYRDGKLEKWMYFSFDGTLHTIHYDDDGEVLRHDIGR